MTNSMRDPLCAFIVCLVTLWSSVALGGVVITAMEVGDDVIFEGGGNLDITLWSFVDKTPPSNPLVDPDHVFVIGARGNHEFHGNPVNFAGPRRIGPGDDATEGDGTGDLFGMFYQDPHIAVPTNYNSGDPLRGSATFDDDTFDSLGIAEGVYTWTWDTSDGRGDFMTLNIVPAPGTIALLGLTGLTHQRRRRS